MQLYKCTPSLDLRLTSSSQHLFIHKSRNIYFLSPRYRDGPIIGIIGIGIGISVYFRKSVLVSV